MHAAHDAKKTTANARAARWRRYEDRVDPDRTLSEADRQRRAESLRQADMTRLALRSAQARRKRKQT